MAAGKGVSSRRAEQKDGPLDTTHDRCADAEPQPGRSFPAGRAALGDRCAITAPPDTIDKLNCRAYKQEQPGSLAGHTKLHQERR